MSADFWQPDVRRVPLGRLRPPDFSLSYHNQVQHIYLSEISHTQPLKGGLIGKPACSGNKKKQTKIWGEIRPEKSCNLCQVNVIGCRRLMLGRCKDIRKSRR